MAESFWVTIEGRAPRIHDGDPPAGAVGRVDRVAAQRWTWTLAGAAVAGGEGTNRTEAASGLASHVSSLRREAGAPVDRPLVLLSGRQRQLSLFGGGG